MGLADLLKQPAKLSKKKQEEEEAQRAEATRESLINNIDYYRKLVSYWRVYPDKLIDFYCSVNPDNTFHLFFYQRMFIRILFRYKYVYATFVRAWSKSFMSVLCLMLKCILYPGAQVFSVAGGKEQSAQILSEKLDQICTLIPAMSKEIIWDTRGTRAITRQTKDSVMYTFKNGSTLRNVAASEKTRGARFHSGLMEECVGIDQDLLNEVIIPTMNVDRMINGQTDPDEVLNKSQIFITTAGYKNSYSYDKLIQLLCQMVARPKEAFVLGGSWRVPVKEGLLNKDFVKQLKLDGTFNEASFEREYESRWTGDVEAAFFQTEQFDRRRIMGYAENEFSHKISDKGYYVMGVDVGRLGCTTEVCIFKVQPSPGSSTFVKRLVNIYTFEEEHFGLQAIKLKRLFNRYKCRGAVIDGNGLGTGLVDFLTMDNFDPDTGETLWNWGVINDEDRKYKHLETENTIPNAMYVMKANQALNSEMYVYCQSQLSTGRILFLIDESTAKNRLLSQTQGQKMSQAQRAEYLMPYTQTSILRDQMANLLEEHEGMNIVLKQSSRKIKKDKFSAFIYGLYWCKMEEDKNARRKRSRISDFVFFTKH